MRRRTFLCLFGLGFAGAGTSVAGMNEMRVKGKKAGIRLFLCGDVMTGRGIDQVLPHPGRPHLYEPWVDNALRYVELAERANGSIPSNVSFDYIWGDALDELHRMRPDLRLINLETAVTTSEDNWPGKGIHYRMHPDNLPCLHAAAIDACVLANNHVLDWGHRGLIETLNTLQRSGIRTVGAGHDDTAAAKALVFKMPGRGRVLLFAFAHPSSGTFEDWRAGKGRPGVNILVDLSERAVARVARQVKAVKQPNDLVVFSIHWGGNWGYQIPSEQRWFAHRLIDEAGVDVLWGHSSHHPKGIEVYRGRPILYGCGDLLNDYEGISGHEAYRGDLALMYFLTLDPERGHLLDLEMTPMQVRRFRLQHPSARDSAWLQRVLKRECALLGTGLQSAEAGRLTLTWQQ